MRTIEINTGKGKLTVSASHDVKITEKNIIITLSKVAKVKNTNTALLETKAQTETIKLKADGTPDRRAYNKGRAKKRGFNLQKKRSITTPS